MRTFETGKAPVFRSEEGSPRQYWKTTPIHAIPIDEPFQVKTLEGTMTAKAGDFLAIGASGELYAIAASVFGKTYNATPPAPAGKSGQTGLQVQGMTDEQEAQEIEHARNREDHIAQAQIDALAAERDNYQAQAQAEKARAEYYRAKAEKEIAKRYLVQGKQARTHHKVEKAKTETEIAKQELAQAKKATEIQDKAYKIELEKMAREAASNEAKARKK